MNSHDLQRGVVVGVLLLMVLRSIVWLATPSAHPDATLFSYALNVASVVICGATAWATWRPGPRVQAKVQQILAATRRI